MTPRTWTPEERAAFAQKMKDRREAARMTPATDDPDPNPLPTDHIKEVPLDKGTVRRLKPEQVRVHESPPTFSPDALISTLQSLPLDSLTYESCGLLLNALSVATTNVGRTRRERQEQMAAGTPQAKCETCHRTIDISKSGGFQILTVRDEHFQPVNRYYCSQNCLLARNMPSHRTKKLPGDVGTRTT